MSVLTEAIYNTLAGDATLVDLLAQYDSNPAIFTTEPAPGDAVMPYIITAGEVAQVPFDTKTTLGRVATRDIRCYTTVTGSAAAIEAIAERVRELTHRTTMAVSDYKLVIAECSGPTVADEQSAYGRILTIKLTIERK